MRLGRLVPAAAVEVVWGQRAAAVEMARGQRTAALEVVRGQRGGAAPVDKLSTGVLIGPLFRRSVDRTGGQQGPSADFIYQDMPFYLRRQTA